MGVRWLWEALSPSQSPAGSILTKSTIQSGASNTAAKHLLQKASQLQFNFMIYLMMFPVFIQVWQWAGQLSPAAGHLLSLQRCQQLVDHQRAGQVDHISLQVLYMETWPMCNYCLSLSGSSWWSTLLLDLSVTVMSSSWFMGWRHVFLTGKQLRICPDFWGLCCLSNSGAQNLKHLEAMSK